MWLSEKSTGHDGGAFDLNEEEGLLANLVIVVNMNSTPVVSKAGLGKLGGRLQ